MIEWKGESKTPVRLVYKVIMKGASEPDNYLHLVLDPAEGSNSACDIHIMYDNYCREDTTSS